MRKFSVLYSCTSCDYVFSVPLGDPELYLLSQSLSCPREGCKGEFKEIESSDERAHRITAHGLFLACMGMGLPEERACSPEQLNQLLLGKTISAIEITASPDPGRSIVSSITVDGKKIHLASSNQGASIYKVTNVQRISRSPSKGGTQTGSSTASGTEEKPSASTSKSGRVRPLMSNMQTSSSIRNQHNRESSDKDLRMQNRKTSSNRSGGIRTTNSRRKK